jgi:hypothetical protein
MSKNFEHINLWDPVKPVKMSQTRTCERRYGFWVVWVWVAEKNPGLPVVNPNISYIICK